VPAREGGTPAQPSERPAVPVSASQLLDHGGTALVRCLLIANPMSWLPVGRVARARPGGRVSELFPARHGRYLIDSQRQRKVVVARLVVVDIATRATAQSARRVHRRIPAGCFLPLPPSDLARVAAHNLTPCLCFISFRAPRYLRFLTSLSSTR